MAYDRSNGIITLVANAGGETSGVGVLEIYNMPTTPTSGVARVKCVYITNLTAANGYIWLDDNETDATALSASCKAIQVGANETIEWVPEEEWYIVTGIIAAGSNAAVGSGYRIWAEVEILK